MNDDVPPRAPGAVDLRWDKQARELQFTQLQAIRSTAEKWRNGLTAVTGVLTAVVALAAPRAAVDLRPTARWTIGVLLLLGLLALAVATWLAMRAAFGIPESIRDNGARLHAWSDQATGAGARDLKLARHLAVGAFILFSCAATVGYVAHPSSKMSARIVTSDGRTFCGTLTSDDAGKVLVVIGADAVEHAIPLVNIVSVEPGATC